MNTKDKLYRHLVESTDDSIYLVDKNYQYIYMNKKHISRLGLSGEQFMERAYSEFHSSQESKIFIDKINKVFNSGESKQYEYRSERDGKYFLQTFSPVKDSSGKTIYVGVISKEITERKKMEKEIDDKMKKLEDFFEMAVKRELIIKQVRNENEKLKSELLKYKK